MATTEPTINDALADTLRETRRIWRAADIVRSENTELIEGSSKRPDILVLEPNVSPVVIETEVLPARTVGVCSSPKEKVSESTQTMSQCS
jgi:hypothetical protein